MEWSGYKVHVTETCDEDAAHLVTHVRACPAMEQDMISSGNQDATSASSRMRLGAVPFREGERSSTEGNGTAETAFCGAGMVIATGRQ